MTVPHTSTLESAADQALQKLLEGNQRLNHKRLRRPYREDLAIMVRLYRTLPTPSPDRHPYIASSH